MTLASTGRSKERILVFGMEGVGKSLCALDIAAAIHPKRMFVVDNDNAWDRMLEGQTLAGQTVQVAEEYTWDGKDWVYDDRWCVEGGNVVVYHADGWVANRATVEAVREEAAPDDWCCIDSGTALWGDVQDWYTDQVFSRDRSDHLLALKLAGGDDKDEDKWQIINAQYQAGVGKFLVNPPCHLIVTAEQKDVNVAKERDKEIKGLYGSFFLRPAGQKRLGHNVQTILLLEKSRGGEFTVRTVKDRGARDDYEGVDVTGEGFATWYLQEMGWTEQGQQEPSLTPGTPDSSTTTDSPSSADGSGASTPAPSSSSNGLTKGNGLPKAKTKPLSKGG